jgi:hypothetical protein
VAVGKFSLALIVVLALSQTAQSQTSSSDPSLCFGFSFGKWAPPLNWQLAGHGKSIDTTGFARAPGGRDWAIPGLGDAVDSSFVLFPAWWPVGVLVELPRIPTVINDTVAGRATALVADARNPIPKTTIRAWQALCRPARSSSSMP